MQKLKEQHRQIKALAGRLRELLAEGHPAENSDLVQVRLALSVLLRDHLALEEELIYAPLRSLGTHAEIVQQSDQELQAMRENYSRHIREWPASRIEPQWSGYGKEVLKLIGATERRIQFEEMQIYPLVA
jgi:hypothetical protein